jgi:hypothetical protein
LQVVVEVAVVVDLRLPLLREVAVGEAAQPQTTDIDFHLKCLRQ